MSLKKTRFETGPRVQKKLQKMLSMAAGQKLIPKVICSKWGNTGTRKIADQYKNNVKGFYSKSTKKPLKYQPEEAMSDREKFQEKVRKLANNQIPLQYLDIVKTKNKNVMMYKNHQLEEVIYPTKKQYKIFHDFGQNKFNHGYSDVFDDKLQFQHVHRVEKMNIMGNKMKTCPIQNAIEVSEIVEEVKHQLKKPKKVQLPKLISVPKLLSKKSLSSPRPTKKASLKIVSGNQQEQIYQRMRIIGRYSSATPLTHISLTKESIVRYFRQFYTRPHRIIDFLQIGAVENYLSFSAIPQRIKFMPKDHFDFMAFIFYDSNNDGIICNLDLVRLFELTRKCPLLEGDYNQLKNSAFKDKTVNSKKLQDLYKLPQITETAYFKWKNAISIEPQGQNPVIEEYPEYEAYMKELNRKKTFISFKMFQKIFKHDKPLLWYDILWRISGLAYQGFNYV